MKANEVVVPVKVTFDGPGLAHCEVCGATLLGTDEVRRHQDWHAALSALHDAFERAHASTVRTVTANTLVLVAMLVVFTLVVTS